MLRVLIADDHFRVRQGLRDMLREGLGPASRATPGTGPLGAAADHETVVVGEARTGHEALDQVRAQAWDVVVLDVNLPDQSGLEVLRQIRQERPTLPVILLSLHPGTQYIKGSLKAGAAGYLNKETAPDELIDAIRTVLAGGVYVSRSLGE